MYLLLIPIMAIAGRAHGANWQKWTRIASIVVFALVFGIANYELFGIWWLAILSGAISAIGFSAGHGRFYAMNGANIADTNPEWIEKYLVSWWYKGDISKPIYSGICMGIKGLIIGIPVLPIGGGLAIIWPISYLVSFRIYKTSVAAEWLTGALAGLIVLLS